MGNAKGLTPSLEAHGVLVPVPPSEPTRKEAQRREGKIQEGARRDEWRWFEGRRRGTCGGGCVWGIRIGVLWPQGRANTQKNGEISQAAGRKTNRPGGGRRQGCRGGEAGGGGAHIAVVWRVGGVARSSWFFAVDGGPPHHSVSSATFLVFLVGVVRESEGSSQTADRRTA